MPPHPPAPASLAPSRPWRRRGHRMKRREFVAGLSSAAAWPLMSNAQQPTTPLVGFIHMQNPTQFGHLLDAFRAGLSEGGYVEGETVRIEYRWAENDLDRV